MVSLKAHDPSRFHPGQPNELVGLVEFNLLHSDATRFELPHQFVDAMVCARSHPIGMAVETDHRQIDESYFSEIKAKTRILKIQSGEPFIHITAQEGVVRPDLHPDSATGL